MSLYKKAGLVQIPSGYKAADAKLYSVVPNNGDGDFDFTRASTATRVNKDGLIETVAINQARLDYPLLDGVVQDNPVLLLEPSRQNVLIYSEALSNWTNIQNATVTDNDIVSPDGSQNASRINETTDNAVHRIFLNPTVASAKHSFSVFLKKGTRKWAYLRLDGATSGQRTWFDLENGVLGTVNSDHIATIEDFGNGWYRCSVSIAGTTYDTTPLGIIAITTGNNAQEYVGDVNEYIYAWGAQLEAGSYPTSYIKTQGETNGVTRSADICNGAGTANDFNDSEGVLYANISALTNTGDDRWIAISDGGYSNQIKFAFSDEANKIRIYANGSSTIDQEFTISDNKLYKKIALSYSDTSDAIKLYVNGLLIYTTTSIPNFSGFNELAFDNGAGVADFYGKTKELMTFKEALTDIELEALTSYKSFNEMATEQLYTIK